MATLTATTLAKLPPGRHSDGSGDGLHLWVKPNGAKYWVIRRMHEGRRVDRSLGPLASMSLQAARKAARALVLPSAVTTATTPTFAEMAAEAHAARRGTWRNRKHGNQWTSTLETYAFPVIGTRTVDTITRADVLAILLPIWASKHETARRVRHRIAATLAHAVAAGHLERSLDWDVIALALPRVRRAETHLPAMPHADVPLFVKRLPLSAGSPVVRAAIEFAILTASRPGNVTGMLWEHVDLATGLWTIPGDDMKGGREHRVHITPRCLTILSTLASLRPNNTPFVFWSASINRQMPTDTLRMSLRRMGTDFTIHGFRSSFKEWSLATGWADHLSELQLAHADQNRARRAYARSDQLEQRLPMMLAWEAHCSGAPVEAALRLVAAA